MCDRRYSYRASKTALNQLTKTMAVEFGRRKQKVACILLHPGTVDTDLSAPFQKVYQMLLLRCPARNSGAAMHLRPSSDEGTSIKQVASAMCSTNCLLQSSVESPAAFTKVPCETRNRL
jgi:NAD(P)-dependent dehydrogenase (short-subunit alcohol dehydrogenase family)